MKKYIYKISIKCFKCNHICIMNKSNVKRNQKRNNGKFICSQCKPPPQRTSKYWTLAKKQKHSKIMRNSEKYYKSLKTRKTVNGMKGKKHSIITKQKMSIARTGKMGEKATAWKGGQSSLNCRIRHILHTRFNWYYRVYKRDNFRCTKCKTNKIKLDAHHIKPLNKIIKELLSKRKFKLDSSKIKWLIKQPEIIDIDLKNGLALCRNCHKKVHKNWGSHDI